MSHRPSLSTPVPPGHLVPCSRRRGRNRDTPLAWKPLAPADVVVRQDLLLWLRKESEERGATVIYATHIFDGLDDWPTHLTYLTRWSKQAGHIEAGLGAEGKVRGGRGKGFVSCVPRPVGSCPCWVSMRRTRRFDPVEPLLLRAEPAARFCRSWGRP